MRLAMEIFRAAVRAMAFCLSSSMVPATTAAPYFFARAQMWAMRSSPSSRFIELRMQRPPCSFRPASITLGSVLSSMMGALTWPTKRLMTSCISAGPVRPTKSTQTSSTCEPSFTSSLAIATRPSQLFS
jgi:hypothetical protein